MIKKIKQIVIDSGVGVSLLGSCLFSQDLPYFFHWPKKTTKFYNSTNGTLSFVTLKHRLDPPMEIWEIVG